MNDYEMMSPAEREAAIRKDYASAQESINALVHRLTEEYSVFEYLRDLITEIEIYGADDVFCQPKICDIKVSKAQHGYIF